MLSCEEALTAILRHTQSLGVVSVDLSQALGYALAQTVRANRPFPHFDNAAVDGFAVRFKKQILSATNHGRIRPNSGGRSAQDDMEFKFKGEVPAGDTRKVFLKPGEAMAIFTGAPVPAGTQAVVMQEYAQRSNGSVLLQELVEPFENIREAGEDFKKGDPLIPKGIGLEPQHLALLAALGHSKIKIIRPPKVGVLATGNEIIPPGDKLKRGQIYDSNTPLVEALIKKTGAHPVFFSKVKDGLAGIRQAIRKGLRQDVLIVCGGVSVGKYDFVKEALRREGVREIFWKIDIKPGKPVFFGKKGKTLVFGLPGNPVSVYVTFEEFVKPALLKMMNKKSQNLWTEGRMTKQYQNGARPHFIRVQCQKRKSGLRIIPVKGQGSHQIGALVQSDGILKVDANQTLKAGQVVRVKSLRGGEADEAIWFKKQIASPLWGSQ
jgi:molybdopterin molybdotransferase